MSTSYANPGGTGNRTGSITVATSSVLFGGTNSPTLVDGVIGANGYFWNSVSVAGEWVEFDFGSGNYFVVDEAKFYESSVTAQGTWQWQGSNDHSAWISLGSTFAITGSPGPQVLTTLSGNTDQYRYYRILGISGTANNGPWIEEFEFQISLVMGAPVIPSTAQPCPFVVS